MSLLNLHIARSLQLLQSGADTVVEVVDSLLEVALLVEEGEVVADGHLDDAKVVDVREDVAVDGQQREKHPVVHPLLLVLPLVEILHAEKEGRDNNHDVGKNAASDDVHHEGKQHRKNHHKIVALDVGGVLNLRDKLYLSFQHTTRNHAWE